MSSYGTKCAGHEGAGVIVKIGERVRGLKVGMRAGFKPIADVCHVCDVCKAGRETYCNGAMLTGKQVDGVLIFPLKRILFNKGTWGEMRAFG